ncbi:magnesium transporter [Natronosalvus rutilus]|uniref:Magnesium transporter n=2 Tax=Natronosalvus rutilus TaxID=2953753 RepID=A0A9E7SVC8_9EURY|nr:magnesium transporter [Natronosalvus rutilus]UTF53802.1 magnesium transporter [Natronosalvus rutilus]
MSMPSTGDSLGSWSARSIVVTMFPLLIVLSIIVLAAGITLDRAEALLEQYRVLAIMVPTMVGLGGNLGAILSSRLSSRLHLGVATFDVRDTGLWANVAAILALAVTVFTVLAIGSYLLGLVLGFGVALSTLLFIALVSGLSIAVIAVVCSFGATYASYRLGIDPDDLTIPIVTNVVDVFGMLIFVGVSWVVLGF